MVNQPLEWGHLSCHLTRMAKKQTQDWDKMCPVLPPCKVWVKLWMMIVDLHWIKLLLFFWRQSDSIWLNFVSGHHLQCQMFTVKATQVESLFGRKLKRRLMARNCPRTECVCKIDISSCFTPSLHSHYQRLSGIHKPWSKQRLITAIVFPVRLSVLIGNLLDNLRQYDNQYMVVYGN